MRITESSLQDSSHFIFTSENNVASKQTAQDYIEFFEAIPEEFWCVEAFSSHGQCCAFGHLGARSDRLLNPQALDFQKLAATYSKDEKYTWLPDAINDGEDTRFEQETPKERTLALCRAIQIKGG